MPFWRQVCTYLLNDSNKTSNLQYVLTFFMCMNIGPIAIRTHMLFNLPLTPLHYVHVCFLLHYTFYLPILFLCITNYPEYVNMIVNTLATSIHANGPDSKLPDCVCVCVCVCYKICLLYTSRCV